MSTPPNLLAYLVTLPGRCELCGAHTKTQGHTGGCTAAGVEFGRRGMERATEARPAAADKVEHAIRHLAATGKQFSANDARKIHGVKGGVVGATFNRLREAGVIQPVGLERSSDPGTHGHRVNLWIGAAA